jgi:excisionase family DNA binding protein
MSDPSESFSPFDAETELTARQAADVLNVSMPFLNKLLDMGDMPYRTIGGNRRILYSDLITYKKQQEIRSKNALQELADQAQELDMGY